MSGAVNRTLAAAQARLAAALLAVTLALLAASLAAGAGGWSPTGLWADLHDPLGRLLLLEVRAPRGSGAWLVGALLGLAGAIGQGVFRNPLADPYLLGSASGAVLGVVAVLAASTLVAASAPPALVAALQHGGLVAGAFVGALGGVVITLALAGGAPHTVRLLLAGVVVGVTLGAASDLLTLVAPETLRGKQGFLLGSTALLGWPAVAWLALGLALVLPPAWLLAPLLDALTLGEDTATTLGLPVARLRMALVGLLALATALAVSQAGLVAFIGLVAPHLVRRLAPARHGFHLLASAAMGGVLLLAADVLARTLVAPHELPVGVLSALLGGLYLWLLLRRRDA